MLYSYSGCRVFVEMVCYFTIDLVNCINKFCFCFFNSKLLSGYLLFTWKTNKTLKCGMRYCFGVEHITLSAKYKREQKTRAAKISLAGPRPSLWPQTYFSPRMLWARFPLRLTVLQNGELKRTAHLEIAFHSITRSINLDGKARTSWKGDASPKVTLDFGLHFPSSCKREA